MCTSAEHTPVAVAVRNRYFLSHILDLRITVHTLDSVCVCWHTRGMAWHSRCSGYMFILSAAWRHVDKLCTKWFDKINKWEMRLNAASSRSLCQVSFFFLPNFWWARQRERQGIRSLGSSVVPTWIGNANRQAFHVLTHRTNELRCLPLLLSLRDRYRIENAVRNRWHTFRRCYVNTETRYSDL